MDIADGTDEPGGVGAADEGRIPGAAVLPDAFNRLDDGGVDGQALGQGWQFTVADHLLEFGSLVWADAVIGCHFFAGIVCGGSFLGGCRRFGAAAGGQSAYGQECDEQQRYQADWVLFLH